MPASRARKIEVRGNTNTRALTAPLEREKGKSLTDGRGSGHAYQTDQHPFTFVLEVRLGSPYGATQSIFF